jgi:hypothetical protein
MRIPFPSLASSLGLFLSSAAAADVIFDASVPQLQFAAAKLEAALGDDRQTVRLVIRPGGAHPEGFSIERSDGGEILIVGASPGGAMYGGLELAEQIRISGTEGITPGIHSPRLEMRGIKFNIPLDVRTPSYSDMGEAAQYNIPHMWDLAFWKEYIDEAASHRYNYISLWNLHPFPSLVKIPGYPDIALDDVKRAVGLEKKHYDGRGRNFDAGEILDETETLIEMTIDEKIGFWREVMRYGKTRGVDFHIVTWNVFDYGTEGKYGINDDLDNKTTIDYFRKSVKALFLTYPDLKGIGITTGENMHDASDQEKEDWVYATYGLGVLDVLKEQPERKITFLHRQHQAGVGAIAKTFQPLADHPNVDFIFSYKYAQAHSYSATRQPAAGGFVRDLKESEGRLTTIWTMRNDSTYLFRWAAPDFLREFVRNIPMDISRGYYFGSDGWVWGRDFVRLNASEPGELEMKRHWLQWLLWGRLAYDAELSNERLAGIIETRFPQVNGAELLEAWNRASMVYPLTTGFHWGALDFHWYPEACVGVKGNRKKDGFHDVDSFITLDNHPGTDFIDIETYVEAVRKSKDVQGTTPHQAAAELLQNADQALAAIAGIDAGKNTELSETLQDIEAMALLSRYYGHKIEGSTRLHLFREGGEATDRQKAVAALESAAVAWRAYTANLTARYRNPLWLARIRSEPIDWNAVTRWVEEDIAIARGSD